MRLWPLAMVVGVFYALHQDFWNWDRVEPLIFGFLPVGLAYHALYSVVASAVMWMLVRYAWPAHLEEEERRTSGGDQTQQGPSA